MSHNTYICNSSHFDRNAMDLVVYSKLNWKETDFVSAHNANSKEWSAFYAIHIRSYIIFRVWMHTMGIRFAHRRTTTATITKESEKNIQLKKREEKRQKQYQLTKLYRYKRRHNVWCEALSKPRRHDVCKIAWLDKHTHAGALEQCLVHTCEKCTCAGCVRAKRMWGTRLWLHDLCVFVLLTVERMSVKERNDKKNETKKSDVEIWCCCCCRLCSTLFSFFLYSDNDERTKKKRCWQISFLCLSLNSCARLKLVLCLAWSPNTSRMHTH